MIWNIELINQAINSMNGEQLLSLLPGNFYWKDLNGLYCGANNALLECYGYNSLAEIVGKSDYDLWPSYAEESSKNDQKVIASEKPQYFEESISTPTRGVKNFAVIKAPLKDSNNKIIGIIASSIDITAYSTSNRSTIPV